LFAHAVLAIPSFQNRLIEKRSEVIDMGFGPQDDTAASPSIAAVWAASGHE
jgi:hypothetical protein